MTVINFLIILKLIKATLLLQLTFDTYELYEQNAGIEKLLPPPVLHGLSSIPCVAKLCEKYFKSKRALAGSLVIANITPQNISYYQTKLLETLNENPSHKMTIMVKNSTRKHGNPAHVTNLAMNYFIFVQNLQNVIETLAMWSRLPTWNPLAQLVIFFTERRIAEEAEKEIRDVLQEALRNHMLNVNIIYETFNLSTVQTITWYPYADDNCGEEIKELLVIDECQFEIDYEAEFLSHKAYEIIDPNDVQIQSLDTDLDLSVKIPSHNLHGCPLKVSGTPWAPYSYYDTQSQLFQKGIEVSLILTISEVMSLTPEFRLSNDTRTNAQFDDKRGIYSDVYQRRVDLLIGGLNEDAHTRKFLSNSIPYYQDDLTWCVAKARPADLWLNIFFIFSRDLWIVTIIVMFLIALLIYIVLVKDGIDEDFLWTLITSMSATLGLAVTYNPNCTTTRLLFLWFLLYGLIFSTLFHGFLLSILTSPKWNPQIKSVKDAYTAGVNFSGGLLARSNYDGNDYISRDIRDYYHVCDNVDICLNDIRSNEYLAVAVPRMHILSIYSNLPDIYCFTRSENIYTYSVSLLAKKHHHLLPHINSVIRQILEFGFFNKWEKDTGKQNEQVFTAHDDSSAVIVLTIHHILGALLILAIGSFLSWLAFLLEYFVYWNVKRKSNDKFWQFCERLMYKDRYFIK